MTTQPPFLEQQDDNVCQVCGGEGFTFDCFDGCCEDAEVGCDDCCVVCHECKGAG
jgi:hypothetical protein